MFHLIYQLVIYPIEILLELAYSIIYSFRHDVGMSIIGVSIVVNILLLPLYSKAEKISDYERARHKEMSPHIDHIKKTFSGDERFMILQTYYRKKSYRPLYALRSSLPLLLQIPFFIAAYHFLSHLSLLNNMSFIWIKNLSAPDGILVIPAVGLDIMPKMIVLPGIAINILPILMTMINIISAIIYTNGAPLKEKLQLYLMAGLFLVLLYNSPSGLVIYWTMNNIFSLVKSIVLRIKQIIIRDHGSEMRNNEREIVETPKEIHLLLLQGSILLTFLLGVLIPSSVIVSSPSEFVNIAAYKDPLRYVLSTFLITAGALLIWLPVFYYLASGFARKIICACIWIYCGISLIDYLGFGKVNIVINTKLKYQVKPEYSAHKITLNLIVLFVIITLMLVLFFKSRKIVKYVYGVLIVSIVIISSINIVNTEFKLSEMSYIKNGLEPYEGFTLSKKGMNVVVIMLDRGIGTYIPFIMAERPELKEKFSGFVYYPNTISYGGGTIHGAPALFGGYEYTPESMDTRSDEKLVDKHDESLKIMPVLFSENGYKTTVYDPPYARYKWISDLSIYDDYPKISAYSLKDRFTDPELDYSVDQYRYRTFCMYSIYKSVPLIIQDYVYDDGHYHYPDTVPHVNDEFIDSFSTLLNLDNLTTIEDSDQNTFMMMDNEAPHSVGELQLPDYLPVANLNNRGLETGYRIDEKGNVLEMDEYYTYHVNISPLIQIGNWLDFLKENGVYDNTRIIIVSDHGCPAGRFDDLIQEDGTDMQAVIPLLLYKDFNASGFTVCDDFMTNGDTPILAMNGLIDNPVNPFTNKEIDDHEKLSHDQLVLCVDSSAENPSSEDCVFYRPGQVWYTVHDNVYEKDNWTRVDN